MDREHSNVRFSRSSTNHTRHRVPDWTGQAMTEAPLAREVRLKPEFAGLYENMPVGSWLAASVWAEVLVARAQRARHQSIHQRTFDPRHFEFRGGPEPRKPAERQRRTRSEDRW
jgi:hypothetical protein